MSNSHSQSQQGTPSASTSTAATAQLATDEGARELITGYPLAAGFTSVADVIHHLDPPKPYLPPSLFSSPSAQTSTSTPPGPSEPLFEQYSAEVQALLGGQKDESGDTREWRARQLDRARRAMGAFGEDQAYDGIHLPPPHYPLPSPLATPSAASSSSGGRFLDELGFPYPSTLPSFPAPLFSSSTSAAQFFGDYLAQQRALRSSSFASTRPRTPPPQILPPPPLDSSPDPLSLSMSSSVSQPNGQAVGGQMRQPAFVPSSSSSSLNGIDRSEQDATPRRPPHLNGTGAESSRRMTDSERARASQAQTPRADGGGGAEAGEGTGVESAVKRFRIGDADGGSGGKSTGRGTVKVGDGGRDLISRLSDLCSEIFSSDDGFVVDTSSSHLSNAPSTSPTSASNDLFNPLAHSSEPTLSTATLHRLLKLLYQVQQKRQGPELLQEVEEQGLARLLKILERSWTGVSDGEGYWEKGMEGVRVEEQEGKGGKKVKGAAKGKGKAKGKGGSISPRKRARTTAGSGEEDEDEEEEDDYHEAGTSPSTGNSKTAAPRRSSRSVSRSPAPQSAEEDEMDLDSSPPSASNPSSSSAWDRSALTTFSTAVSSLLEALLAARTALAILTLDSLLPKSLFSADYILGILAILRHALDALVFPLLECADTSTLRELMEFSEQKGLVEQVLEEVRQSMEGVRRLVEGQRLAEEMVIAAIYFALSPYLHDVAAPSSTFTTSSSRKSTSAGEPPLAPSFKALRLAALTLIKGLYARYEDQRAWVIEEVLGGLLGAEQQGGAKGKKRGRGGVRLRNNLSIHPLSALILHLVQTLPHQLAPRIAERIEALGTSHASMEEEDVDEMAIGGGLEVDEDQQKGEEGSALAAAVRELLQPAIESAHQSARTVIGFLMQKSCKSGKAVAGSTEAEYKAVFDHLIADLLATLHLPEWPASEILLTVCCKSMMSSLSDPKSTHELNALKGLSLDHVGNIAARIRHDRSAASHWPQLQSLQEIIGQADLKALEQLYQSHQQMVAHLVRADKAEGASEFVSAVFGDELASALALSISILSKYSERELQELEEAQRAQQLKTRLETLATGVWADQVEEDVFGPSTDDEQPTIDGIALQLARYRPLAGLYDPLLENIIDASDSSAVGFRTKALRDIGLIVAQDPDLFHQANIRKSIEDRMHDSSPAVRDAAIELVGKYVVGRPDLAREYLPQICERITDTGLSVRRRVVKLLKALFSVVEQESERVEICRRLVWRAIDDDEGIKELAVEAVEELWFSRTLPSTSRIVVNGESQSDGREGKSGIAQLASIIMAVAGESRDRPPPVDEVLRMIIAKHAEKGTSPPIGRLREVIETLIDSLVEDEESRNLVTTIKTIHVLSSADPGLLSASKAQTLIPFLKSTSTPQDQLISDYLLKIFRSTVSLMPKSSSKMGKELQSALAPMLNKPPPNLNTLQEVVACFCAVVRGQTHDFAYMVSVFRATSQRLAGEVRKLLDPATQASANLRSLPTLCHLAALLCENGLFDSIRSTYPETKPALDAISPKPISEFVYGLLFKLHGLPVGPVVQSSALSSLGFLFRAYPTLKLHPPSTTIMDTVFDTGTPQTRLQMLKILQDFLASQSRSAPVAAAGKKVKMEKGVKIDELVGNVDGFADSGVASAVSQRYIEQVLSASLSPNAQVQRVAVDILTSVARSGFSHPLAISPTLVALTTSSDPQMAGKGYATLALLHQKHASLLATRFAEPAKTSHSYARAVAGDGVVHGYREDPTLSHFGRWYSLLQKEKRNLQHDYLKTLSRMLELEPGAACSEDDVSLARYVAEALSTLEYKRLEEPMLVISYLNSSLAVAGLQVLHMLEEGLAGGGGLLGGTPTSSPSKQRSRSRSKSGSPVKKSASVVNEMEIDSADVKPPSESLARQSLICGIALLLRDHLKHLYSITDAKLGKYVIGKKSAQGDRAAVRRAEAPLALGSDSYERMPFAVQPMSTEADLNSQRQTYISLVADDGRLHVLDEAESEGE